MSPPTRGVWTYEVRVMSTITITRFRENIFDYVKSAIEFGEVLDISTKDGNAVVMSKEDYDAIMETFYLLSVPGMSKRFIDALDGKAEYVPLSEVWPDV